MKGPTFIDILRSTAPFGVKIRKMADGLLGHLLVLFTPARRKLNAAPEDPNSILVIRPGGIGDAVFLIPLLKRVRAKHPGIRLDVLCEKRNRQIFDFIPGLVDNIYLYDNKSFQELMTNEGYDIAIDTEQWHILSTYIAAKKSKTCAMTFGTRPQKSKLVNIAVDFQPDGYELDNFKALFAPVIGDDPKLANINAALNVPTHLQQWAEQEFNPFTVTVFPGGSISIRKLDTAKAIKIIQHITECGCQPILIGGKSEVELGEEIMSALQQSNVLNFINKISLKETAALIQRSRLFVGCDSGPLHIAAAVGTPTIGIFGPGNRNKWAPRGEGHNAVFHEVPCAPCTRFGYTVPVCKGSFACMKEIDEDNINTLITEKLTGV